MLSSYVQSEENHSEEKNNTKILSISHLIPPKSFSVKHFRNWVPIVSEHSAICYEEQYFGHLLSSTNQPDKSIQPTNWHTRLERV